jgi:hypothetical protein
MTHALDIVVVARPILLRGDVRSTRLAIIKRVLDPPCVGNVDEFLLITTSTILLNRMELSPAKMHLWPCRAAMRRHGVVS